MAFDNAYNQEVKKKLNKNYLNLIINENNNNYNENKPLIGGSMYGSGTNKDDGYEIIGGKSNMDEEITEIKKISKNKNDGMTAGKKVYKKRIKKIKGGDFNSVMDKIKDYAKEAVKDVSTVKSVVSTARSIAPIAAAIIEEAAPYAPLILGLGHKKGRGRPKKILGGELTLKGYDKQYGQPPLTTIIKTGPKASPQKDQKKVVDKAIMPSVKGGKKKVIDKDLIPSITIGGKKKVIDKDLIPSITIGGKKINARAEIVKKIMKEKGFKMIEASKYVKEHNLYKK